MEVKRSMKICISELIKTTKELEDSVKILKNIRNKNATVKYLKNEEKIAPEKDFDECTIEIEKINEQIRKNRKVLAELNCSTVSDGFNLTLAELIVKLGQLTSEIISFENFTNKQKLSRTSKLYDNTVEYEEICYDLDKAKKKLSELKKEKMKIQMEIDRLNLNTFIDIG